MSRLAFAAVVFALLLTAAPAFADGALHPIACASGASAPPAGCTTAGDLQAPKSLLVSRDGKNAYGVVKGGQLNAGELIVYDRAGDGTLHRKAGDDGCIGSPGNQAGCKLAHVFGTSHNLAMSADDHYVYAVDYEDSAVLTFHRETDGSLSEAQCLVNAGQVPLGCEGGLQGGRAPLHVAVDPGGGLVYVAGSNWFDALTRDKTTGKLTQRPAAQGCYTATRVDPCGLDAELGNILSLVATDEKLYVVESETLLAFDPTSMGRVQCLSARADVNCSPAPDLSGLGGTALTSDGRRLYLGVANGIAKLARSPADGQLSGCTTSCTVARADTPSGLALTPDGSQLYATTHTAAGGVRTYDAAADGGLTLMAAPYGCLAAPPTDACTPAHGIGWASDIVVSPDGRNVYVDAQNYGLTPGTETDAVTAYSRDRGPVCADTGAGTSFGTAVIMKLACSDPDGDALAFSFPSGPAHGTLSAPGADGSVTYVPAGGFAGGDSFTYRVSAFGVSSGAGTATVSVAPPPPATPPLPGVLPAASSGPLKLNVTVAHFWTIFLSTHRTVVKQLTVKKVPAGARIEVRCSGKGCAFKRKKVAAKQGTAKLAPLFKQRRIARNATIEVRVTKPGYVGRVVRFKLTGKSTPKRTDLCLAPGAAKPGRC